MGMADLDHLMIEGLSHLLSLALKDLSLQQDISIDREREEKEKRRQINH